MKTTILNQLAIANNYELVTSSSTIVTQKTRKPAIQKFWYSDTSEILINESKKQSIINKLEYLKTKDIFFKYNIEKNKIMVKLFNKCDEKFHWLNLNIHITKNNALRMFAENFEKNIHIDFKSILAGHMIADDVIDKFPVLR